MARANFGLFLLVMLHMSCQSCVYCTGYYSHMLYKHKQLKAHPWIKHKFSKVPIYEHPSKMLQFTSHKTFFPPASGYFFKAPPMLAPKSAVTPFSKFPFTSGIASHGWKFPYQNAKNPPKVSKNFFKKRNPKYLWIDFPDTKKAGSFLTTKKTRFPNNGLDFPPGINDDSVTRIDNPGGDLGNIYVPNNSDLYMKPPDVNVVSLQPNKQFENTDGFGPLLGSESFNGFPKTDPSSHDVLKLTDIHMPGGGNLPNDVIVYNGNLPQDIVSLDGILPDSISSVPIQLDKIHTDALLASGIAANGGKIHDIGVGKLNGNLPGTGSGNLVVSLVGDQSHFADSSSGSGNLLVNTAVPLLDGDFALSNTVGASLEPGDLPNTFEFDGNLPNGLDISMESGDSRGSVLLGDGGSSSNEHSDLIVTLADTSRVNKIHQPLAKPLSLMLTVEPFGPGPYGTCRTPSKVVCGARFGWEHVVGMASWCKQNCVVYMYTSYCDDDRCQCECE